MPASPFHFTIDPDIRRAATLPARVYRDPALFEHAKEAIFARSWQLVGDRAALKAPGTVVPVTFLEGEPDRADAYRSLLWSLLATNEFLFNH